MSDVHIIFEGKMLTQSRFNGIEKFVLEYFYTLWDEIWKSIDILRKNNAKLLKSELCLAFVGADSLSRFREIITTGKEEKKNEDRLREWFDSFVFTDKNEVYKKHKGEISCNSAIAWKLRNSLLHFYGLPESRLIGFSTLDQSILKKFISFVFKERGEHATVVNPYLLIEAMLNGFLIQGEVLVELINGQDDEKKEVYIKGIVKCYEIIQKGGSVYVPLKKYD